MKKDIKKFRYTHYYLSMLITKKNEVKKEFNSALDFEYKISLGILYNNIKNEIEELRKLNILKSRIFKH